MTDQTADAGARPARTSIDWETVGCLVSVVLLTGLSIAEFYADRLPWPLLSWHWAAAFGAACAPAVLTCWIVAIIKGRLPARPGATPKLNHISGWSFLLLAVPITLIIGLAMWAATSDQETRAINAVWGIGVVVGLAVVFMFAAWAPSWNLDRRASWLLKLIKPLVTPFGILMSIIDSLLVFVVAPAGGASRNSWPLRYLILAGVLLPCAWLGYQLLAPWGLIPLAWGFAVTISMSRRWAWVEDDRELAMLNARFSGPHLRIGFDQDLRDEAMLSFMSMFFLVPLALRQVQEWQPIFDLNNVDGENLLNWVAFYGAELAKAVPFVDWAEIYNVHGDAGIQTGDHPMAKHVIFATRVLVDLVFLAALLQALAISARNAKQRELFQTGTLNRLDPFIEKTEFRKLVRYQDGKWQADEERVANFPPYDAIRLGELSDNSQPESIQTAAKALRMKQGGSTSEEFHDELMRRAMSPKRDKEAIIEVVHAIRAAGPERQVYELDQARRALNNQPRIQEARTQVMRLLTDAPPSPERTLALLEAIQAGDLNRDSLGPVRAIAIAGLAAAAAGNEPGVVAAIREAETATDSTQGEKREARTILRRLDGG